MKNKMFRIFFLIFLLLQNIANAQDQLFNFKTKSIEIEENGNLINAKNGKAISKDGNFEIIADNFQYLKDSNVLKINGNALIIIKSPSLRIKFDKGLIDQKESKFEAYGKIEVNEINKNIGIKTEKIIFDYSNDILFSPSNSVIDDNYGNNLIVDSFNYTINKNLLKINNLNLTDKNKNNLKASIAYLNTKTNNLFGKDIFVNLDNKSFSKDNEPRLKGNKVMDSDTTTEITKGVFTTCKRRDGCPPWQLSAKKIRHDKINQTIHYEQAYLKIYDTPIIYFPKFYHPDPTVNRKSGFLAPAVKNSNNRKSFLDLPYYLVISDNKDATFSPRFYNHEEFLLQTEYRQVNDKSNHVSDFSFKIDDDKNLISHLFYDYNKIFNSNNTSDSNVAIKFQKTSKDTYIKKNNIESKLITDENILENSIKFDLSKNDMSASFETIIYEDLNKENNDRYEYLIPNVNFVKNLDNKTSLDGNFTFKSQGLAKNYNTNVFETVNINDLIFKSSPKITKEGFYNNYEFIIKNSNTDAQNSASYKNKENIFLSGLMQLNSSLPLVQTNENYKKIINPKLALKIAPSYTKDSRNNETRVDISNVYSLNRALEKDMIEGGVSLAYGNEFSVFDKKNQTEIFNFEIANNLRLKENDDLPGNSQIGQTVSSIFNEISYKPNEMINIKYNSSIKNNLSDVNYENLITEFRISNLVTSFDYLNHNNSLDKNSYLTNTTEWLFDDSSLLAFSTRKNKTIDLTEYYNLAYQYKNDCLSASIEYDKEFYTDRDVRPNESIFLRLTIIPFGQTSSPNFKK
jgi:LPS-assembly protein